MKKPNDIWIHLPVVKIIGRMMFDPVWSQRVHGSNGFEILHVLKGKITVSFKNIISTVSSGDLLLVPSGMQHRDDFDLHEDLEVFFCSMNWEHEKVFLKPFGPPRRPLLIPLRNHDVLHILEDLRTDFSKDPDSDRVITGSRLMTLLMLIYRDAVCACRQSRESMNHIQSRQLLLFEQAKEYITRHYAEYVSLNNMATALNTSTYHLSRIFSQESEFTLVAFLTEVRMRKAALLLSDQKKNVAETAYAVGFNDQYYFSRVFHRYYGCSPTDFVVRQNKANLQNPGTSSRK